jgi:cytoplasmic tRNA 2-thiolation protein 2
MESYRLKNDVSGIPRKLLLPVSGGISSVVLLQILDSQLQRQLSKRGQNAYTLLIVMIETPSLALEESLSRRYDELKARFPSHDFSLKSLSEVFELDSNIFEDFSELRARKMQNNQTSLIDLLSSAATASARADILQLLLTRLIVAIAKQNACEAILWGHSDSRLAAKALSCVAKGRGGYLPYEVGDGPSPWGITFNYPMRDLFKPELVTYANALPDEISRLVIHDADPAGASISVRATAIDDLLSTYINNQGEKYPSIMANVVRTATKLRLPSSSTKHITSLCSVCAMPALDTQAIRGAADSGLCYACQRLNLETKFDHQS